MKRKNLIGTVVLFALLAISQAGFCGDTYKVAEVDAGLVNAFITYSDGTTENVMFNKKTPEADRAKLIARFLGDGWVLQATIKDQNANSNFMLIFSKKE
ncbi:MAG TPA: hypothetical protein VG603_12885 [Chitinophagales bacterium]|nr:hypothetical protein [Chitinophagales bacterium]